MAILGPTASGKTAVAIEVALRLDAEIISVDSMQVYRGMDIGTAKPTLEERRGVEHHMIDVVDPDHDFTVAEFRRQGRAILEDSDRRFVICGGSGLHFRALVDRMTFPPTDPGVREALEGVEPESLVARLTGADPEAAAHVDLANLRRVIRAVEILEMTGETPSMRAATREAERLDEYVPEIEFTAFGFDPGDGLPERVVGRLQEMREAGLVEEVDELWPRMGRTARGAVGYREIAAHLEGELDIGEAFAAAERSTMKLARRQRTWFRRDPRIQWIAWNDDLERRVVGVIGGIE